MVKFFRKIRQNLLSENKFTKYLAYALGEIILVVIGILIALAINNGNQNRIDDKNEQIYLLGLKEEFETSKFKLTELIAVNQRNYIGAKKILEHTATKNESLTETTFSELLYNTFSADIAFNPNNSLLNEMINSGNLKNLSNTELRKQLTNWISTMEDISRQEEELGIQREKVLDIFKKDPLFKVLYTPKIRLLVDKSINNFSIPELIPDSVHRFDPLLKSYLTQKKNINLENK